MIFIPTREKENVCCAGYLWNSKTRMCQGIIDIQLNMIQLIYLYSYDNMRIYMKCMNVICHLFSKECHPGQYGINCSSQCPYPSYGKACQKTCSCESSLCHHVKGCSWTTSELLLYLYIC